MWEDSATRENRASEGWGETGKGEAGGGHLGASHEVSQAWHGPSFLSGPGYSTLWPTGPEQSDHVEVGPRESSKYPAGTLRGGC